MHVLVKMLSESHHSFSSLLVSVNQPPSPPLLMWTALLTSGSSTSYWPLQYSVSPFLCFSPFVGRGKNDLSQRPASLPEPLCLPWGCCNTLYFSLLHILILDYKFLCKGEANTHFSPKEVRFRFTTFWSSLNLLLFLNGFHLYSICTFY